jgi:hypothetical protein
MLEFGFTADRPSWTNASKWAKPAAGFGLAKHHLCVNAVGPCPLVRRKNTQSIRFEANSSRNETGRRLLLNGRAGRRQRRKA